MTTPLTPIVSSDIEIHVLQTILSNLVTVPEDIKITKTVDDQGVLLSVMVNPQDMGIIIGRNGSMAMALKSIMRAVGKLHRLILRLQFLEPDGRAMYGTNTYDENRPKPTFNNPGYGAPRQPRGGYNPGYNQPNDNYNPGYGAHQPPVYPKQTTYAQSTAVPPVQPMNPIPVNSSLPGDDLDEFMLN